MQIKMLCKRREPNANQVLLKRAGRTKRADAFSIQTVENFVSARALVNVEGRIGCCGLHVRDDELALSEARRVLGPHLLKAGVVIDGRELKPDDADRQTEDCMYTLSIEPEIAGQDTADVLDVVECIGVIQEPESKAPDARRYRKAMFRGVLTNRVAYLDICTWESAGFAEGQRHTVKLTHCECDNPPPPKDWRTLKVKAAV